MTKSDKLQLKVVEIAAKEFKPGSKYLIVIEPQYADWIDWLYESLVEMGVQDVVILPCSPDDIKVYSIPEDTV